MTDSKVDYKKAWSGLISIFAYNLTPISSILYGTDARCG